MYVFRRFTVWAFMWERLSLSRMVLIASGRGKSFQATHSQQTGRPCDKSNPQHKDLTCSAKSCKFPYMNTESQSLRLEKSTETPNPNPPPPFPLTALPQCHISASLFTSYKPTQILRTNKWASNIRFQERARCVYQVNWVISRSIIHLMVYQ